MNILNSNEILLDFPEKRDLCSILSLSWDKDLVTGDFIVRRVVLVLPGLDPKPDYGPFADSLLGQIGQQPESSQAFPKKLSIDPESLGGVVALLKYGSGYIEENRFPLLALSKALSMINSYYPEAEIEIVGHSMGGLLGSYALGNRMGCRQRSYYEKISDEKYPHNVRRVIAVSPPPLSLPWSLVCPSRVYLRLPPYLWQTHFCHEVSFSGNCVSNLWFNTPGCNVIKTPSAYLRNVFYPPKVGKFPEGNAQELAVFRIQGDQLIPPWALKQSVREYAKAGLGSRAFYQELTCTESMSHMAPLTDPSQIAALLRPHIMTAGQSPAGTERSRRTTVFTFGSYLRTLWR